eukprot:5660388-Lingulodinium_polyedra.AAC.1
MSSGARPGARVAIAELLARATSVCHLAPSPVVGAEVVSVAGHRSGVPAASSVDLEAEITPEFGSIGLG